MMSKKLRLAFAMLMIGALAACKSGVKLDEHANQATRSARNRIPKTSRR